MQGRAFRVSLPGSFGQAEVQYVRLSGLIHQDVRRFQVAVDHAALVGVIHCRADLLEQRQRLTQAGPRLGQVPVEAQPVDVLHGEVEPACAYTGVEDGDDVGVSQGRGQFDLALEAPPGGLARERPLEHHLQSHAAFRAKLDRLIDHALAAAVQFFEELIAGDSSAFQVHNAFERVARSPRRVIRMRRWRVEFSLR